MSTEWIPNYIRKNINYKPKDILTAQEYNALLNLIITQGDYNSAWLEYLQTEGIPDAIAEISAQEIAEAISTAVRQEIESLAASVENKTSAQLNNPAITILNVGQQYSGISDLKTLLDSKNLAATYAIAVNLVGQSAAYPTLAQLTTLKSAGSDIVAYSTDGSPVTAADAATVADTAKRYMGVNNFNDEVFIYPEGNSLPAVTNAVHEYFEFAANESNAALVSPEGITLTASASILGNIPIIKWDNTIDIEDIKDYIDSIVEDNGYMILQINTDASSYDATDFEAIVDYMLTKSSMEYPETISDELHAIQMTIMNRLHILEGIAITEENGVKYLNF